MSIQNIFQEYNVSYTPEQIDMFERFLAAFIEYNAHTNLSAIRDEVGIIEKHFVDSLVLERFTGLHGRVLDIGTGGGFPGIPLAIRHPETSFTLLDSVGKKVRACEHFARELGLSNITTIHARAEELVSPSLRARNERGNLGQQFSVKNRHSRQGGIVMTPNEARDDGLVHSFDFVVSRATAYLPQILIWAEPFLCEDGEIVLYKLPSDEELREGMTAAKKLWLVLTRTEHYGLSAQDRVLLFFKRREN